MKHDRQLTLTTAPSSKALSWRPEAISWSAVVQRLAIPQRSTDTQAAEQRMTTAERSKRKDVGGFVGGAFKGERRRKADVTGRDLITLDMDALPADGVAAVTAQLEALGCAWVIYSTRSHRPEKPRIRVILPLAATAQPDEYEPIARKIAQWLGIQWCDPTTFQAERMMYWPSASADGEYLYQHHDGPLLDGQKILANYDNWRDIRSWPRVPGTGDTPRISQSKKTDPATKTGVVGAFCREYPITDAIKAFLPDTYAPVEGDPYRYTYTGGSTTGGAIVYDDDKYLCSHHATDPVGDRGVCAFDLVRIHRFGQEDESILPDTPINRLPSYQKMAELAMGIQAVKSAVWREQDARTRQDFEIPDDSTGDPEWMGRLKRTERGIANTSENALILLTYDPVIAGRLKKDSFSGAVYGQAPMPWVHRQDQTEIFRWTEDDMSCLRIYRQLRAGIKGKDIIEDAFRAYTAGSAFNPIKDYITATPWDGVKRLDTLLIDYLGARDTPYVRRVTRMMLVASVARALSDRAVKFDTMCVLTGHQGAGKSTFIRKRAIHDLYTDGVTDFDGKNAAEIIQGKLFIEIAELSALYKSDINRVKTFLSQEADDYRAAYGRVVEHRPRRCVFWGTSNDYEYLNDPTGNRRFLPIDVMEQAPTKDLWEQLDAEKPQIWAEAYRRWQLGEPLYLTGKEAQEASKQQETHNTPSARDGVILDFLDKPVPANWLEMDLAARRMFWAGGGKPEITPEGDTEELVRRDRVCAQEVFQEAFGGDLKHMRQADTREINRVIRSSGEWKNAYTGMSFGYCGRGRGFARKSEADQ
jgi:hypothetical protein